MPCASNSPSDGEPGADAIQGDRQVHGGGGRCLGLKDRQRPPAAVAKVVAMPDVHAKLEGIGADGTVSRSPAEFAALVKSDTARYAKIVKDIGLKID